jgi:hypothetical protein
VVSLLLDQSQALSHILLMKWLGQEFRGDVA